MQNFEHAHYDQVDDINLQVEWLDSWSSETEVVADQANDNLAQFPDELADTARADLQETRADALQGVNSQRESTQESVWESKDNNLDRNLVLSINEKFSDVPLEERRLFESMISKAAENNLDYQRKLTKILSSDRLVSKIKKIWLPTSDSSLTIFNKKFKLIDRKDHLEDTAEKTEDTIKKMRAYSAQLKELWAPVSIEVFNALESWDVDKLKSALGDGTPWTELYKLWVFFKEQWEEEYKDFKESIISMDQDFQAVFTTFENNYALESTAKPANPGDVIIAWNIPEWATEIDDGSTTLRTYVSADGSKTEIDTSVFPPKREVSLSGSEYRLETETPMTRDIQEISTKYELAHNELWPKINSLSKLIKIMETIGNSTVLKLDDVKNTLINKVLTYSFRAQNPEVVSAIEWADSMMSLQNLATTWLIAQLKKQYEDELESAEREYKQDLADQVDSYRDMMSQKDIQAKKTLKLLKDTGFDLLPQSITDQLIAEIESGQLMLELWTPFDPKNVDLVNGDFGEPKTLEWSNDQFVKNLVRFMNKMIGLKPDGTDTDGNLIWLSEESYLIGNAPHTPEEIRNMILEAGIISGAGWFNLDRARNNLSRPLSELEKDTPEPVIEENTDEWLTS